MGIAFRFKLIPFVATVLVVALGIQLGNWQQRRAAQKIVLQTKLTQGNASAPVQLDGAPLAAEAVEFRRVSVTGEFVANWPLYLDNRPSAGRSGFYLLMPFKIAGTGMHVLVARGWLPRDPADRARLPAYATPSGTVTLQGMARLDAGHVMELARTPTLTPKAIVQNADPLQVARDSGLTMQPFVIEQTAAAQPSGDDAQMVRDWPAPALNVEKHQGYAFQWYALSAMAVIFFVVNGFRRGKQK
ncbi:SURF1 family protein [Duganella violaceipulchra]|uniref:SURF1-like protein n=1 Tax=Duganella violaceipulchra TaxID=2849652 RepID=A0AA41L409_9BURK|nr:SURF1 family protein [Duganella violaceicalia]MBV6322359.1 SURF1 family protein [Duganella violaceicalia]MCP2011506.1 cytochrome oxidase assembly protein ShyY1 [Duganella violaceicalia]